MVNFVFHNFIYSFSMEKAGFGNGFFNRGFAGLPDKIPDRISADDVAGSDDFSFICRVVC